MQQIGPGTNGILHFEIADVINGVTSCPFEACV